VNHLVLHDLIFGYFSVSQGQQMLVFVFKAVGGF